ncbi:hypothetical protein NOR_03084 [Metarhizium rileyi]|uniref:Uncharacterized protein n=1 Tax=Metarhizium rileyi (strain RCEF 4871) TaxID=1649241 RepID=A0A167G9N3_METRR|nr:hypothetical protein NOR_03084 [Metarhizium rileyi RCEF 4871]TWU78864.1 hypothetical protein ED733_007595 [Metarhizium rileyi]
MKSTVATLGMLAAVASAFTPGRQHMHFPRANTTSVDSLTTLTVKTTQIRTITSCAPTVTNCPARSTGAVVTDTIVLTEIVCPVTEVGKVSSSVLAKASSGGLTGSTLSPTAKVTPAQPTLAANATSALPGNQPGVTAEVTPVVSSKTVTLTLGTGSTASVVTSIIPVTLYKTIARPTATTVDAITASSDSTTTMTATTRITRTVTISKTHPTIAAGGNGDCASATVTVTVAKETVTVPASTVYVTIGGAGATESHNQPSPTAVTRVPASSICSDDTTTLQRTVTAHPFPINNGTNTSGSAKPTGYARLR